MSAPNFMVFVCSLDRAKKYVQKAKRPDLAEGVKAARDLAMLHYRAKDYARAVEAHNEAWKTARMANV